MEDNSLIIKGIEKIVNRSRVFLNENREFAPFGIIYRNDKWIDIAAYDENMDSNVMRGFLINAIKSDFQKGDCSFGGVCVHAKIDNLGNVIIIYNSSDGDDWFELIYKYFYDEKGNVIIEERNID